MGRRTRVAIARRRRLYELIIHIHQCTLYRVSTYIASTSRRQLTDGAWRKDKKSVVNTGERAVCIALTAWVHQHARCDLAPYEDPRNHIPTLPHIAGCTISPHPCNNVSRCHGRFFWGVIERYTLIKPPVFLHVVVVVVNPRACPMLGSPPPSLDILCSGVAPWWAWFNPMSYIPGPPP